jgi:hypothetical protein
MTLGTVTGGGGGGAGGPLETTRLTEEPGATLAPAAGVEPTMLPAGTLALVCCVMLPTASPAAVSAVLAADWVWPMRLGTDTGGGPAGGPLETTRLTDEPDATLAPAAGLELTTLPAATVALDCWVMLPTTRPAAAKALLAAA